MDNGNRKRPASKEVVDLLWDTTDDEDDNEKSGAKKRVSKQQKAEKKPATTKTTAAVRKPMEPKTISTTSARISTSTTQLSALQPAEPTMLFNVATYNVWFGPPHPAERMLALAMALVEKNSADCPLWFIGMQEVTSALRQELFPILEAAGYRMFCQDFGDGYGCAMAVLQQAPLDAAQRGTPKILDHGWQSFDDTVMQRGFLFVRAQLPSGSNKKPQQIIFTTTHLESFVGNAMGGGQTYTGAPQRKKQILQMERFCTQQFQKHDNVALAVISGDLNWDDERIRSEGQDPPLLSLLSSSSQGQSWTDSWTVARDRRMQQLLARTKKIKKDDEPVCYTYDAKLNPMLGGNLRRRFDRVVFRLKDGEPLGVDVDGVELIGQHAIEGLTWSKENPFNGSVKQVPVTPSDHFGYVVSYRASGIMPNETPNDTSSPEPSTSKTLKSMTAVTAVTAADLPPEPPADQREGVCTVQIRAKGVPSARRRFDTQRATLEDLLSFASTVIGLEPTNFQLVTQFPRRVYSMVTQEATSNSKTTFAEAGIEPGQQQFIVEHH